MAEYTKEAVTNLIRIALDQRGWSAAELARHAGVAPSTITRALDPNNDMLPSTRTMGKIARIVREQVSEYSAELLAIEHDVLAHGGRGGHEMGKIPVAYTLRPGTWAGAAASTFRLEKAEFLDLRSRDFAGREVFAVAVDHPETDREFGPGAYFLVAHHTPAQHEVGDTLCVKRQIDTPVKVLYEILMMDICQDDDGLYLDHRAPRYRDEPRYRLDEDYMIKQKYAVMIMGAVVAVYIPRIQAAGSRVSMPAGSLARGELPGLDEGDEHSLA